MLFFDGNLIKDQIFYGTLSVLIAAYGAPLVHISNNTIRNVGYLNTGEQISLPYRPTEGSNRSLPFSPTTISRYQQVGFIELGGTYPPTARSLLQGPLDPGDAHVFEDNYFRNVFAKVAGIINTDYVRGY